MDEQTSADAIDVSILFISYNRSDLLKISRRSLQDRMDFGALRVEYILTDDGSDPPHLVGLGQIPWDEAILWPVNTGLGANCNRGLAAARGEFILQIQDDCEFVGSPFLLQTALEIMYSDAEIGVIQLTNQTPMVSHSIRHLSDGTPYWVFANDGLPRPRECGNRPYSDQPHLKRRVFVEDLGAYAEGVPMAAMEIGYQQRVACQAKWKIAHLPQEMAFRHRGEERSFNESVLRAKRLARQEHHPVYGLLFRWSRRRLRNVRDLLRRGAN